jgi:hypothetical protein
MFSGAMEECSWLPCWFGDVLSHDEPFSTPAGWLAQRFPGLLEPYKRDGDPTKVQPHQWHSSGTYQSTPKLQGQCAIAA